MLWFKFKLNSIYSPFNLFCIGQLSKNSWCKSKKYPFSNVATIDNVSIYCSPLGEPQK
jgi:hypothetical protein